MESTRQKIVFTVCFILFWIIMLVYNPSKVEEDSVVIRDYRLVMDGDLIFRSGSGLISEIAKNASNDEKRFSHVGIVVKKGGGINVIHSIEDSERKIDGVVLEGINDYLNDIADWAIYRVQVEPMLRDRIGEIAFSMLSHNILFDYELDLTTTDRQYCTEFVSNVVNQAVDGQLIIPNSKIFGKKIISVEDVHRSNKILLISEFITI